MYYHNTLKRLKGEGVIPMVSVFPAPKGMAFELFWSEIGYPKMQKYQRNI